MNLDQFAGIYRQFAGRMIETWGKLTGNPLRVADGRLSRIAGKNQLRSGVAKEESARQLKDFLYRNRNWHL